ncbi:MAG: ABC transporter permease [Candidatus Marinimicrobia bacterium]|nr:ABC transporter permease [Candidatus Neomarinimicrobiota bacterium]
MIQENIKIIIQPSKGWQPINWRELWQYRDLFYFLVWRDIKTRYAQSVLGIGWAVIQPIFSMIVFTIVFGKLARINSDGVPYAIFSYTALVPWTYFSGALSDSSSSLLSASGMMTKVYFPRLVIPISPVMSKLVDFTIAFIILLGMMAYFGFYPTMQIIYLPLLILLMMLTASGMGMWLTAMSIQYRDIKYAMGFFVQLMMYGAPVVYPASNVPEQFRLLYGCFPMAGVIEGFRSILLQTNPIPWDLIGVGSIVAMVLFISGAFYFRRMEQYFSDVA